MFERIWLIVKGIRLPMYWASGGTMLISYALAYSNHALHRFQLWAAGCAALLIFELAVNILAELHDLERHVPITLHDDLVPTGPFLARETGFGSRELALWGGIALLAAALLGFYLALETGYTVILSIGAAGVALTALYAFPPFELSERSWGEIVPFLSFGPLPMIALYFLLSGTLSWSAVLLSIPNALWVTAIRFVHHMPDTMNSGNEEVLKSFRFRSRHASSICGILFLGAFLIAIPGIHISRITLAIFAPVALISIWAFLSVRRAGHSPTEISRRTKILLLLQFAGTAAIAASLMVMA